MEILLGAEEVACSRFFRTSGSGFTMLEAMVILVLLVVGIIAAGSMHTRAVLANAAARRNTHASFLAASQMEKLMALPYDAPTLGDRTGDGRAGLSAANPYGADGNDSAHAPYMIFWNVAQAPAVFNPTTVNYKQIRVIVTWKARGKPRRLSLNGYRARS